MPNRPPFTLLDLIVLLCLAPLLVIGCQQATSVGNEQANRAKCASNLRQIGQAMTLYANDNRGHFPRTAYVPGPNPIPVWGTGAASSNPFALPPTGPQPNDISAAIFLLLRTQIMDSAQFTCPSSNAVKDPFTSLPSTPAASHANTRSNFSSWRNNLSYSMHNPYVKTGVVPANDSTYWGPNLDLPRDFAIAADMNPGTAGGNNNDDDVRAPAGPSAPRATLKRANSNNHDKEGQNVLYADGHVHWHEHPFVGAGADNIFTTADGQVVASPATVNESIMLPTDD